MKSFALQFALLVVHCVIAEEVTNEELARRLEASRKLTTSEEKLEMYNSIIPHFPKKSDEDFPEDRRVLLRDAILKNFELGSINFYSNIPRVFKIEERVLLEKYVTNIDSPVHRAAVDSYLELAGAFAVPHLVKLCQNPKIDLIPHAEYIKGLSRFPCPAGLEATIAFRLSKRTKDYWYVYYDALACYPEPQAIKETSNLKHSTDRLRQFDWQRILRMRKDGKLIPPLRFVLQNGPESWKETAAEELKKLEKFNEWYKLVFVQMSEKSDEERLPLVDALCTMDEQSRQFLQSKLDATTDPKEKAFLEQALKPRK